MSQLGNGLSGVDRHEDALSVREAELARVRRLGASEQAILEVENSLACTYRSLGRLEDALRLRQRVYSGRLKLGGEHPLTLSAAFNYASSLLASKRFKEAKSLMRKSIPVARRVIGDNDKLELKMRWTYAVALYEDAGAKLDDLREAVETLKSIASLWKRVFGEAHPETPKVAVALKDARKVLAAASELGIN